MITVYAEALFQSEGVYPFGLTFNSFNRENSLSNQFEYNGKETQDELNLGWMDYGARMYMPEIGRWMAVDPLSDLSRRWSPYTYCYNSPLLFVDPDGMFGDFYDQQGNKLGTDGKDDGKVYVVTDKKEISDIELSHSEFGYTGATQVNSKVELPSAMVRGKMGDAVVRSNAPNEEVGDRRGGFHEEGGIFGTNPNGDDAVVEAKPGQASVPGVDQFASVDVFSGETSENALTEIKGTYHVHPAGVTRDGGSFDQSPSDFIDNKTARRMGDIPSAKSQADPDYAWHVTGNHYVLGARNNTVTIYNGTNPKVATFPLDKFTTIGVKR
jgi:RHS repeat-associated protein